MTHLTTDVVGDRNVTGAMTTDHAAGPTVCHP
jgi:hypothetical protein